MCRRYAYFKQLDYFSTECIYSPNAYRGFAREFLKDLEAVRPTAILGRCWIVSHFVMYHVSTRSCVSCVGCRCHPLCGIVPRRQGDEATNARYGSILAVPAASRPDC